MTRIGTFFNYISNYFSSENLKKKINSVDQAISRLAKQIFGQPQTSRAKETAKTPKSSAVDQTRALAQIPNELLVWAKKDAKGGRNEADMKKLNNFFNVKAAEVKLAICELRTQSTNKQKEGLIALGSLANQLSGLRGDLSRLLSDIPGDQKKIVDQLEGMTIHIEDAMLEIGQLIQKDKYSKTEKISTEEAVEKARPFLEAQKEGDQRMKELNGIKIPAQFTKDLPRFDLLSIGGQRIYARLPVQTQEEKDAATARVFQELQQVPGSLAVVALLNQVHYDFFQEKARLLFPNNLTPIQATGQIADIDVDGTHVILTMKMAWTCKETDPDKPALDMPQAFLLKRVIRLPIDELNENNLNYASVSSIDVVSSPIVNVEVAKKMIGDF